MMADPGMSDLDEAAARWTARHALDQSGTTGSAGDANVAEASAADASVQRAWDTSGLLAQDPEILALRHALLAPRLRPQTSRIGRSIAWGGSLAVAASIAFVVAMGLSHRTAPLMTSIYESGPGQGRDIALADGTKVRLDGKTALTVRFDDKHRTVTLLHGRAYFDVVHQANRPFEVTAADVRTVDIGTHFTVDRSHAGVTVDLIEGAVNVHDAATGTVHMVPGDQVRITPSLPPRLRHMQGDPLGWTHGQVIAKAMPLAEVVEILSRYTVRPITLAGPATLASRPVTGVFDTSQADDLAETLALALSLKSTREPDGSIVLSAS